MNPLYGFARSAIVFALVFSVAFVFGVLVERGRFLQYKGEVKGAVSVQEQTTKAADKKNEGEAHATEQNYVQAINDLNRYWTTHPVIRVQHDNICTLSQTPGNPTTTNGTAPGGNAATYISPYSPQETERVAIQLHMLQQLLIADGVTIK